jgi:hypothetical protein
MYLSLTARNFDFIWRWASSTIFSKLSHNIYPKFSRLDYKNDTFIGKSLFRNIWYCLVVRLFRSPLIWTFNYLTSLSLRTVLGEIDESSKSNSLIFVQIIHKKYFGTFLLDRPLIAKYKLIISNPAFYHLFLMVLDDFRNAEILFMNFNKEKLICLSVLVLYLSLQLLKCCALWYLNVHFYSAHR